MGRQDKGLAIGHKSGYGWRKFVGSCPRRNLSLILVSFITVFLLGTLVSPAIEAADPAALAGSTQESGRISFFVGNPPQAWQEISIQIGSDLEKNVEAKIMSDTKTAIYTLYLIDVSIAKEADQDKCRELLNKLVDHRLEQESIGLGLAKDTYEVLQAFSQDEHTLKEAIRSINFNQDKVKPLGALYEALEQLNKVKKQKGGLGRIVYLSNSSESASSQKNLNALKKLIKAQGTQVYTVAYSYLAGDKTTEKDLKDLAEKSKALYFNLEKVELSEISSSLAKAEQYLVASRDLPEDLQDGSDKKVRISIETDDEVIRLEDELTMPFGEGSVREAKADESEDKKTDEDASGINELEDTAEEETLEEKADSGSEAADAEATGKEEVKEGETSGFSAWLKNNWLIAFIVVLVIILAIILGALVSSRRRIGKASKKAREAAPGPESFSGAPPAPGRPLPYTPPVPPSPPVIPVQPAPPMSPAPISPPAGPVPEAPQPLPFMPPVVESPALAQGPQAGEPASPGAEIHLEEDLWEEATVMDLESGKASLAATGPTSAPRLYDESEEEKTMADLDAVLDKTFVVPQAYLKLPVIRLCDAENPEVYVEAPVEKDLVVGRSLQSDQGLEIPDTMGRDNNRRRSIGRKHCLFTLDAGRYFVEDLNSTNGSYLNGQRLLDKQEIKNGDRITLGLMDFIFETKEPRV